MSDIDYAARVQRGIALMDEEWPDWADRVDVSRLDIQSGYNCMTAQYAQQQQNDSDAVWVDGRDMLHLTLQKYEEHGFKCDESDENDPTVYPILNDLWMTEIRRRRATQTVEQS